MKRDGFLDRSSTLHAERDGKRRNVRLKIFQILQPDDGNCVWSRVCDWTITALIMMSVAIVFAGTFDLPPAALKILSKIESIASVVFSIEYVLRISTADFLYPESRPLRARIRYVFSFMAIIDLVAILPFWLPMIMPGTMLGIRAFRLVRLLRILKLNRYFDALRSLGEVITSKRRELLGSLFFVAILMLLSSLLMYSAEHDAQPNTFRNAFSGLWWAVATLTTVGYGDIYPVTALGRVLGAIIAFSGIAAVAIPTGIITSGLSERLPENTEHPDSGKNCDELKSLLREQGELLEKLSRQLAESKREAYCQNQPIEGSDEK